MAFLRSRSAMNSAQVALPTLSEQNAPAMAPKAFNTSSMSSTKPDSCVGTEAP
jgi:hypothetical protein